MSSLAGALASPRSPHTLQITDPDPLASPKAEDTDEDNLDDIQPNFPSPHASPDEHGKDEDKDEGEGEQEMNDLFGEDEDVNLVQHERPASSAPSDRDHADQDDGLSSPERRHREQMEYPEEDEPEPVVEQRLEADVAIPNIPVPRSSDGSYWVIRMPNFIKVDSKPFHPDTYVGPEQEDDDGHQSESLREKSMSIKLKVENTVRWRWSKDQFGHDVSNPSVGPWPQTLFIRPTDVHLPLHGTLCLNFHPRSARDRTLQRRQSNSRIVRWSDGSLSLQLGKELFDITQSVDTSGAVPRQALGGAGGPSSTQPTPSQSFSQSQSLGTFPGSGQQAHGLTYLVAQHKRAEILQCEALVTGYMSLRPTGMQSETHRMLVRAVGQKHTRVARLRMAPEPTTDPERERLELERAAARKPRKSRGGDDDPLGATRRRRSGYARKRTGDDMWSDDDDDDAGFGHGGEDEDYGDDGDRRRGKRKQSGDDSGKKGPGEYERDDFLVADTDEDDDFAEEETRRRKRKRAAREEEEEAEEDDLERLEAKITQNEAAERKRRQREGAGNNAETDTRDADAEAAGEDAMDVESEEAEEDDDFSVRRSRTAPGPRKRRAVGFDEDDED
ncbi:Leo1-like protein-domain-containing protein [Trametes maxima]|nr:Leo1-like protein-domain-containing protein [Trametes maxima]